MELESIINNLHAGVTQFGPWRVIISSGGTGGRYQAHITGAYTLIVETPNTVNKEGIITFIRDRLAPRIKYDLLK